jgi:hypothetical protein
MFLFKFFNKMAFNSKINHYLSTAEVILNTIESRSKLVEEVNERFKTDSEFRFFGVLEDIWIEMGELTFDKATQDALGTYFFFKDSNPEHVPLRQNGTIKTIRLEKELSGIYLQSKTLENSNFKKLYLMKGAKFDF